MVWCTNAFINLKTFVRTQNLAFVRMYTFRMKSTESFIHEAPGVTLTMLRVRAAFSASSVVANKYFFFLLIYSNIV